LTQILDRLDSDLGCFEMGMGISSDPRITGKCGVAHCTRGCKRHGSQVARV
jgi:hypothetical protein